MRGRFLEAILSADRARAGRPGRPGTVDGLVVGGALGGAAPSLGRARLPCRARWAHHPPQGCPLVPWRLPPLHPLAPFARETANLGRIAPRERGSVAVSKLRIRN